MLTIDYQPTPKAEPQPEPGDVIAVKYRATGHTYRQAELTLSERIDA